MPHVRVPRTALLPALALALFAGLPARAEYGFTFSTFDPPMGRGTSQAFGISASGAIVGAYRDNDQVTVHGYTREGGTYTTFDYGTAEETSPRGINDLGDITGYAYDGGDVNFIYDHSKGFLSPVVAGATITLFNNVNEARLVAAVYDAPDGSARSAIYDLNTGTFTLVDAPPGAVNNFLQTVGLNGKLLMNFTDTTGVSRGALFEDGQYRIIDVPGAARTFANAITSYGLIGGNYSDATGTHGFAYDTIAGTYYTLDYPGAVSTALFFSNSDDSFVGFYADAGGRNHSIQVSIHSVPEPGSLALMAIGLGGAGLLARRRRRARTA